MLKELTLEELAIDLRGRLILPDDPGCDDVRAIWSGTVDRRPAIEGSDGARTQGTLNQSE